MVPQLYFPVAAAAAVSALRMYLAPYQKLGSEDLLHSFLSPLLPVSMHFPPEFAFVHSGIPYLQIFPFHIISSFYSFFLFQAIDCLKRLTYRDTSKNNNSHCCRDLGRRVSIYSEIWYWKSELLQSFWIISDKGHWYGEYICPTQFSPCQDSAS